MPRAISIRRSLLLDLVIVILLLGGGLLATTVLGTQRAVQALSRNIINQSADKVELALEQFFDPVEHGVVVARSWGMDGLLDLHNAHEMNLLFQPILEQTPQIASILIADETGAQYQILREERGFRNRLFRPNEWGDRAQLVTWDDGDDGRTSEPRTSWAEKEYDPRDRPWFQGALSRLTARDAPIHWTSPYVFITESEPGITAAAAYRSEEGATFVVGFDVRLEEITTFTSQEHVTDNGLVAVMDEEGKLLGLPADPRFADPSTWRKALLQTPNVLGIPLIDDANRAFQSQARQGVTDPDPVRFESGGAAWWAQGRTLALATDRNVLIAILVPDADVFSERRVLRTWILGLTALVLVVAVIRGVAAARRFSRPMEALAAQSDRISRGDLDEGEPIQSELTEVRQMADAQEHMRLGLVSLMKMERDLQVARQIQQSSFPRRLPEIEGFDIVAWNDPADETGGDTYDLIPIETPGRPDPDGDVHVVRALLLLADATGHGIGPALVATQSRAMLRMAVRLEEGIPGIVQHLNEQLHTDLPGNRFLTAWFGILDARAGTLATFSAGQAPLLYFHAADATVDVSSSNTLPLGMMPEIPIEVPPPTRMRPGDIFAVISDGVFEAVGDDDEQFGQERVIDVIKRHHEARAAEILAALQQSLERFVKGRPADDDRTVWLIKKV